MSDDKTQAGASEVRAGQRIAKVIARAGVCSRRDAEAWIAAGRVTVNGKALLSPAFNVSEADDVRVDGKPLAAPERTRLFLFHKPRGLVTTARDPEGRATVFAMLPPGLPRVVAVGRLDINTEGLLLLTNDGGLARVLELPSTGWLRRYRVRVHGSIDQAALDRLAGGVTIDGVDYLRRRGQARPRAGRKRLAHPGPQGGKNREIKKILEHLGLAVNRLIRISFGPFELGDLPEGEVMEVRTRVLRDQLGVKLAKEANANFDAALTVRDEPAPERKETGRLRGERGSSENVGRRRATQGQSDRAAKAAHRFEGDKGVRRAPPKPSTPERRRKHVSALRAEINADASDAKRPRTRVERSATHDRKGRTVTVERRSRDHGAALGLPGREPPERGRRPTPSRSKATRDGKGREGVGAAHRAGAAPRGAFKPSGARDGRPKGRKADEPRGERSGPRDAARREGGEARRSERGPRSDFKPRGSGPPPRGASPRSRAPAHIGERSGDDRATGAKPPRPGSGRDKGPPSGRGPRRPPRKS